MTDNGMLKKAVKAIQEGQTARAREILTRLLQTDQKNVTYWLYMSAAVKTDKERIVSLENALRADPKNETAKRGLALFGKIPLETLPVKPENKRQWDIDEVLSGSGAPIPTIKPEDRIKLPTEQLLKTGFSGLLAILLIVFSFTAEPLDDPRRSGSNFMGSTMQPLITVGPSPTYLPTNTPEGGIPPSPTFIGPTPLSFSLDVPYTPTPLYVITPHPNIEAYGAGIRNMAQQDYEEAIEYFTQFVDLEPTAADGRYYLGLAYLQSGDYLKARGAFTEALEYDDELGPAYLGIALADLGLNPDKAVFDDINRAITHSPDFVTAYLVRAGYRLVRDNPEGGKVDAEKALELNPDSGLAYMYIAAYYIYAEEYPAALEAAEISNRLDITLIDNYYYLGEALVENG
ncbi:MAG: tetratricopeptide repeat protein, partial [Chloroflexota bacterium]